MKKGIDYIGVGVGGIIFDAGGRIFLARRGREARNDSGKWEFPGGAVEFGEALEHALAREVMEEYGIAIEVQSLLDVVNHLIPAEGQHWVSPTFICRVADGTPVIREPHKCAEIGWFEIDRIPEQELTIASKKSLESLKKNPQGEKRTVKRAYSYPVDAILLLGPTGSGKSPLGDRIAALGFLGRRSHHLDFGSELRSISSGTDAECYSSAERNFILDVLEKGALLENEHFVLAEKIIALFLERSRFRQGDVLVLNGMPRHEGQAKDVAKIAAVHAAVVLVCSVESVIRRIEENTGGDRTGRVDDERMLIDRKLRIFAERTAPLIEYYKQAGSSVYHVEVSERTTTDSAYQRLSSLAAVHPPVALVAEPPQR